MTEREADILRQLKVQRMNSRYPWASPLLLGASSNSHHSITAARMLSKGWVERRNRGGGSSRPAWEYRSTPDGEQALANHQVLRREAS